MYDVKCLALAEAFLRDYPELDAVTCIPELAQDIQDAIEDFFTERDCHK